MNAYVRSQANAAPNGGGGAARSLPDVVRAIVGNLTGEAPISFRGGPPAAALVAVLVGIHAGGLALFGPMASGFLAAPILTAAVLLAGPPAVIAWLASLVVTIAFVPIAVLSASGRGFDIPFVLASAVVLRAILVVAASNRAARSPADTMLPPEPDPAQTQQWAAQLGVLQAASARLTRASGVEAVGRAIVEETRKIIDYHNARVYVLEPGGDVVPIAFEGIVGAYEQVDFAVLRTRLGEGFTGWVAQHGVPVLVNDANSDPRGATIPGTDDVDESMLVVPMSYDGHVVGVITLSKLGLDQFDADDERLLLILADQAATAIESARLLARSEGLAGELRRLLDMSGQLAASLQTVEVANLIAMHLVNALGVDECAISYWDRPKNRLATLGFHPPLAGLTPFFEIEGYPETRRVLDEQVAVKIDVNDPAADSAEVALLIPEGYGTLVMLPLVAKGQSIGLVELLSRGTIDLSTEQVELARTMANEAAMALENARLYEEARALADRDQLTGFYNHRYFHERCGEEVIRAQRSRQPLSVLMLDLDDFKLVNDTFGHLFGDQVLAWTAALIRSTLRASDIPARYGGDEFAILLPDTPHDAAARTADRIRDAFANAAFGSGARRPVAISLAVGAATFPADGRSATELITVADAELYREKRREALKSAPPTARGGRRSHPARRRSDQPTETTPA